ncbi:hypothetical protein [Sulfuricurvum sp.]|uniref:hypothetical protein n=1 Tax=Sulfuricurvum sp. TaxID=2025608 RepID=UPI003BB6519F
MNLAARGSLNNQRDVSPKSFYFKGFPMKKVTLTQKIALVVAASAVMASNAAAALTAADVPMTDAKADITLVFLAVLGVAVIIFGYRKIMSLIQGH